ncbi:multidrug effflux MFS transporter [Kineococcus sp. GCM10028916]|uniref:multidrug effflux MFS transporter n=1 Tax=Kineococcus sp. GCM10028916 TaxID=3273394 RepID=UPI00362A8FA8
MADTAGTAETSSPPVGRDTAVGLPPLLPLAVVVGIAPLATDMYIPALPAIAADLGTSTSAVQLSLTAFLVAFAVGQLLIGPISDAVGRRPLLLAGTTAFAVASVVCALAPDPVTLVAARLLQGLAGAAGSVVGRAVVTDVLQGAARARTISSLAAINALGPVLAPLLGAALLLVGEWRLMFVALACLGLVLAASVKLTFRETLPPHRRASGVGLRASAARMGTLLRIPRFSAYLVTSCCATAGFFAYIATSSFVFQSEFGFSEPAYTLVFATNASCMIASTLVFRRLVRRHDEDVLLSIGLSVAAVGSLGVLTAALLGAGPGPVWACLAVVTGAWGFVITGSATRTQALGQALPGTAAALQGGLAFGVGGLGTPLAGALGGTAVAMGAVMASGLTVAVVIQLVATRLAARAHRG